MDRTRMKTIEEEMRRDSCKDDSDDDRCFDCVIAVKSEWTGRRGSDLRDVKRKDTRKAKIEGKERRTKNEEIKEGRQGKQQ